MAKAYGIKVWSLNDTQTHRKKQEHKEKRPQKKKSFSDMLDTLQLILKMVLRILQHVRLLPRAKKLRFSLDFGLSDAARTGMAAGGIYALVYGIQARLHRSRYISIDEVMVTPNFQSPAFSVHCSGIITTCLAHIMGIAVVALIVILKQRLKEE